MTVVPPVTGGATHVPVGSLDQGPIGNLTHVPGVPGLPPASGLPGPSLSEAADALASDLARFRLDPPAGPSLSEAADALASDLARFRLDPPATVSGTTAAHPSATGTIVTPSRAPGPPRSGRNRPIRCWRRAPFPSTLLPPPTGGAIGRRG